MCSTECTEEDIRLQDGTNTQGRLEVCYNGEWGTVCQRKFNKAEARIVCRKLGFRNKRGTQYCHPLASHTVEKPTLPHWKKSICQNTLLSSRNFSLWWGWVSLRGGRGNLLLCPPPDEILMVYSQQDSCTYLATLAQSCTNHFLLANSQIDDY